MPVLILKGSIAGSSKGRFGLGGGGELFRRAELNFKILHIHIFYAICMRRHTICKKHQLLHQLFTLPQKNGGWGGVASIL